MRAAETEVTAIKRMLAAAFAVFARVVVQTF
jgi:hypothetical protein